MKSKEPEIWYICDNCNLPFCEKDVKNFRGAVTVTRALCRDCFLRDSISGLEDIFNRKKSLYEFGSEK